MLVVLNIFNKEFMMFHICRKSSLAIVIKNDCKAQRMYFQ